MDEFLIVFIVILLYVISLFILRSLGVGSKKSSTTCNNCCPDCNLALNRIKRLSKDKIVGYASFKIFDYKRYICNDCGWEGLRWEKKYLPGKKSEKH